METLAYVGGSRWRIETEFETEKSDVGLDEYETPHLGGVASSYRPVPDGGGVPVEPATGLGGKRCRGSPVRRCNRVVRDMLPRERFGPEELLRLLEAEQLRNERASRSHAKRRAALRASSDTPPGTVVVILNQSQGEKRRDMG